MMLHDVEKTPFGVQARVNHKAPANSDYMLNRISLEPAENGLVVECHYAIKPEVQKKRREKEIYGGEYMEPKRHVFENRSDAVDFIVKEVSKLKSA